MGALNPYQSNERLPCPRKTKTVTRLNLYPLALGVCGVPKVPQRPWRFCTINYSTAFQQPCLLLPMCAATLSGHGPSAEEALLHFGTFSSVCVHQLSFPYLSVVHRREFNCCDLHSTWLVNYLPVYSNCITWASLDLTGIERKNTKATGHLKPANGGDCKSQ